MEYKVGDVVRVAIDNNNMQVNSTKQMWEKECKVLLLKKFTDTTWITHILDGCGFVFSKMSENYIKMYELNPTYIGKPFRDIYNYAIIGLAVKNVCAECQQRRNNK